MEEARRCPHCMAENTPDAAVCTRCGAEMGAQNAPHQLPVGAVLAGRYRVGCCIGEGGFGITYAGWDETLDMKVAVKEYYPAGSVNRYNTQSLSVEATGAESGAFFERGKKRFLDEARTLAKFAYSPNIVGVRDCFFENNTAYIVMEFLEGESLSQYLREHGPMPFAQALALLDPVMAALEGIHAKGLIHRDISPSNLMLLDGGGVKLLDFGTARDASPVGERSLSVVLKPGYAPEEQYTTRGAQGPWSDVYAMSATLYRMITGQTPENALNRMPSDPLPAPSALGADIAPAQERALLHGMAIHASSRIQSMAELRAALRDGEAAPMSAPEDDERTLYCPQTDKTDAPDVPVQAERAPIARDERTQRTAAGTPAERKTAREPEWTARTAVQDVPPQPMPEPPKAEPAEAPAEPPKGKKRREKAPRAKKTGKKKKKTAWIVLAAVVCLLAVAVFAIVDSNRELTTEDLSKKFTGENITAKKIRSLGKNVRNVLFDECTFEDGALEELAKSKMVNQVSFWGCNELETLAPLAEMEQLSNLAYYGDLRNHVVLDGEKMFPVDMNCKTIAINSVIFKDGLAFLERLQSTTWLRLYGCEGVDKLPAMPQLELLGLNRCDLSKTDMSAVAGYKQLTSVELSNCGLETIDFLESCTALESVTIEENAITSLKSLAECSKLKFLYADKNQISSLEGLEDKTSLVSLTASDNAISDLTPLENDIFLTRLELANNQISDLNPISNTQTLVWMDVSHNTISDLDPIRGNELMANLRLSYNQVSNLDACESMIYLTSLYASHNQIENLNGLVNVTQLETVALSDNKLTDISVLSKNAGNLRSVQIADNDISDISALAGNPDMELVTMENNYISDISALAGMSKLKYLSAYRNEITDITALGDCKSLYYVDLGENQIADISPLVASAVDRRYLLLQNNCFTDISTLYRDTEYEYLSLYGNPIEDYSILQELKKITGFGENLLVTWTKDMNVEDIGASGFATGLRFVDTPKDQEANVARTCMEKKHEMGNVRDYIKPGFVTHAEADEIIQKEREQFYISRQLNQ